MNAMAERSMLRGWIVCLALAFTACQGTAPPGDVKKFTPVKSLSAVASYAGRDAELVVLEARHVLPDGTMDLTADYRPRVNYTFRIRASEKDISSLPKRPPGSMPKVGDWIQAFVSVEGPEYICRGQNCATRGMERSIDGHDESDAKTTKPACTTDAVWKLARAAGAPADAAATIRYDANGISFSIKKPKFELDLDPSCKSKHQR